MSIPCGCDSPNTLLYVQPVFVQSSGGTQLPTLQRVLVAFGDRIAFENTLNEALDTLFGGDSGATAGDTDVPPNANPSPAPTPTPTPSETAEYVNAQYSDQDFEKKDPKDVPLRGARILYMSTYSAAEMKDSMLRVGGFVAFRPHIWASLTPLIS